MLLGAAVNSCAYVGALFRIQLSFAMTCLKDVSTSHAIALQVWSAALDAGSVVQMSLKNLDN